jgi:hypothetical protein
MEKTKKQHFIPQTYLRRFSIPGDDGSLFVLNTNSLELHRSSVEDVAERRYFYDLNYFEDFDTLSDEEKRHFDELAKEEYGKTVKELSEKEKGEIAQTIEHYLDKTVDSPLAKFLSEIESSVYRGPLTIREKRLFLNDKNEKKDFANLIALNFVRGKFFRDSGVSMREQVHKKLIAMQAAYEGTPIDEKQIVIEYAKEAGAVFQIQSLLDGETAEYLASFLFDRPWILIENKTPSPFITSDNLLTWVPTGEIPAFFGRGFATKNTLWYLPVSPRLAIEFEEMKTTEKEEGYDLQIMEQKDESRIRLINRHIAIQSMTEIYSSTDHLNYLEKMFRKHPHQKEYGPKVL